VKPFLMLSGLVALLATGVALAAKPPANTVTVTAHPSTVTFGRASTISGAVTGAGNAGVSVTLQANPYPFTGGFTNAGSAVTDASGAYHFTVTPAVNTRYQVQAKASPTVTSPQVGVNVRVKVTLRVSDRSPALGQRVRFSGLVVPAHNGKVALIQRRSSGHWRTVARAALVAATPLNGVQRSRYAKRVRIRSHGSYRVRVDPGDGDHVAGNSARRSL
jgi:flagellar hook-associated protein FlgK